MSAQHSITWRAVDIDDVPWAVCGTCGEDIDGSGNLDTWAEGDQHCERVCPDCTQLDHDEDGPCLSQTAQREFCRHCCEPLFGRVWAVRGLVVHDECLVEVLADWRDLGLARLAKQRWQRANRLPLAARRWQDGQLALAGYDGESAFRAHNGNEGDAAADYLAGVMEGANG